MKFRIMSGDKLPRPFTELTINTALFSAVKSLHGQVGSAMSIDLISNIQVTDNVTEIEIAFLPENKVKVHSAMTFMTKCGDYSCAVLHID